MKTNHQGFSLIETMVASAVMLVGGLALGNLILNQAHQVAYLEDRMSYQNLKEEINQILNDPVACKESLETVKVPAVLGGTTKGKLAIKDERGKPVFAPAIKSKNSYDRITIESISLKNRDVTAADSSGESLIQVQVKRQRTGVGPAKFATIEKPVFVEINAARAIQSCSGIEPGESASSYECLKSFGAGTAVAMTSTGVPAGGGSVTIPSNAKAISAMVPGDSESMRASESGGWDCKTPPVEVVIPLDGSLHSAFRPGGRLELRKTGGSPSDPYWQIFYNGVHVADGGACSKSDGAITSASVRFHNPAVPTCKTATTPISTAGRVIFYK